MEPNTQNFRSSVLRSGSIYAGLTTQTEFISQSCVHAEEYVLCYSIWLCGLLNNNLLKTYEPFILFIIIIITYTITIFER